MRKRNTTAIARMKKGFTIIELLVTISIIGILASLAVVSFSGTQKQARDTQRKSDLKQYQNALEIFGNENAGLYPSRLAAQGVDASATLCSDLGITTCPEDTRYDDDPSFVYKYQSDGSDLGNTDAANYVLWSKLENSSDYWVVCSTGTVGVTPQAGFSVTTGACPL